MKTSADLSKLSLTDRHAWLATMLANQATMLGELAQVAGIVPPERLLERPLAQFERVAAFVDHTDFAPATDDARTWLFNRLGLYLAHSFIERHGGQLTVQANPEQRFYLHFVVTGMRPPLSPDARLDPFAIAFDAIHGIPKPSLGELVAIAEIALFEGNG